MSHAAANHRNSEDGATDHIASFSKLSSKLMGGGIRGDAFGQLTDALNAFRIKALPR
jgi:hypothetical protein